MTPDQVSTLQVRIGNGLEWLTLHDPDGSFYAWWQAGLTPSSKLPAHEGTDVAERWTEWYGAKTTYDKLERQLAREEERDPSLLLPWAVGWKGTKPSDVRP